MMATEFEALLLSENPDAVILTTADGVIQCWSAGAERMFGYGASAAVGEHLGTLLDPPESIEARWRGPDCSSADPLAVFEAIRRRQDGSLIHVDVTLRDVRLTAGDAPITLLCMKDVTRLKVDRDARLVESRYGTLLESMPDGILMVNPAGLIVLANSQTERLFGYGPGELRGQPVELLLPAALRQGHVRHRASFFEQPRARAMGAGLDLHGVRKDGSEFPVEISLSPISTDEGPLVMSAIRDVSERTKADRKFRDLLEAAPDAMVIVDQGGCIVLVNSQTEKLFGYARQDLLGQPIEVLVPARYRAGHAGHRSGFFALPRTRAMGAGLDLYGQRRDGTEFPVEISLSPLETADGLLVSSAIRDISERKRIERVLSEKNVELKMAAEAKDRFLASMSHELRTPLNAIIGFTGTLLMRLPGPLNAVQQRQLSTVQHNGRHLLSLINDMLDLAKIESGKLELKRERIACAELIDEVAATLRPAAEEKGLEFRVDLSAGHLVIGTDRRALSQIVINLTNNAIKFTSAPGVVMIAVVPVTLGGLQIRVSDTGCGIRPEDQARLFQPFGRIDAANAGHPQGTGLGLHLSRQLARLLGGEISCTSEFGKGSCFTLTLPTV